MKKIFFLLILLNGMIFADGIFKEEEVFIKDGKAYFLNNDALVNGILTSVNEGTTKYSTYENGNKIKERVLNDKREVVSEYFLDSNGLINGKVYIPNENGEVLTAEYKKGIINGNAYQEYYGEFDFEGQFVYGIAHGKVKAIDENGTILNYIYSNGIQNKTIDNFNFNNYFNNEFITDTSLIKEKEVAKKDGKSFNGLSFKSEKGIVSEAYYWINGIKKAEFNFIDGMMNFAKIYKSVDAYDEYIFYQEMNKGVLNTINPFVKGQLNGNFKIYYINGDRQEGVYVNGALKGKAMYYNLENKITETKEYLNNTYKSIVYFDYEKKKIASTSEGKYSEELGDWVNTGKAIYYNENGEIDEDVTYTENKALTKSYYPNGNVKSIGESDLYSGLYIGGVTEYYENGVIKAIYNYLEGNLDGEQIYFDENGQKIKTENYEYGELIN